MILDRKSLLECRTVCHSWKKFLDNPKFWLKKCKQKGLTQDLHNKWVKLIQKLEETGLEQKVTLCIIKMHKRFPDLFQTPIHVIVVSKTTGDTNSVLFILKHVKPFVGPNQNGNIPIFLATITGNIEVLKILLSLTKYPNQTCIDSVIEYIRVRFLFQKKESGTIEYKYKKCNQVIFGFLLDSFLNTANKFWFS